MKISSGAINLLVKATIKEDGVAVNVSTATTKEFKFRSPEGDVLTKTASFFTDGTDGIIVYSTEGDIVVSGTLDEVWDIQAYLEFSGGFEGHTFTDNFIVTPNL